MSRFFPNYQNNKITSAYGMRTLNGTTSMHNGIDLVAKSTTGASCVDYITAHTTGIVSSVGYEPDGAGNYVYIEVATGVFMAYFHMANNTIRVKKGDKVHQGQIIGYMGNTGRSTGSHLHFGIKDKGKWVDPTPYLDRDYVVTTNTNIVNTVNVELMMLTKGSKGNQVKTLQRLLNALGFNVGTAGIDGDFGNATFNAVKKFQQYNGIGVDGIVGKDTWNKLLK